MTKGQTLKAKAQLLWDLIVTSEGTTALATKVVTRRKFGELSKSDLTTIAVIVTAYERGANAIAVKETQEISAEIDFTLTEEEAEESAVKETQKKHATKEATEEIKTEEASAEEIAEEIAEENETLAAIEEAREDYAIAKAQGET
jgi:hypothetical protein